MSSSGLGLCEPRLTSSNGILTTSISGCATVGFVATLGPRFGMRTMVITRYAFGYWGAAMVSLLNILTQVRFHCPFLPFPYNACRLFSNDLSSSMMARIAWLFRDCGDYRGPSPAQSEFQHASCRWRNSRGVSGEIPLLCNYFVLSFHFFTRPASIFKSSFLCGGHIDRCVLLPLVWFFFARYSSQHSHSFLCCYVIVMPISDFFLY